MTPFKIFMVIWEASNSKISPKCLITRFGRAVRTDNLSPNTSLGCAWSPRSKKKISVWIGTVVAVVRPAGPAIANSQAPTILGSCARNGVGEWIDTRPRSAGPGGLLRYLSFGEYDACCSGCSVTLRW